MSDRYTRVGAYLDRSQTMQQITVVMSDDPEAGSWQTLGPAVCRLPAERTRELAFCLLALAETAKRREPAR
jgi:hypothetical protein